MKNFTCTCCRKRVHPAAIHDMKVKNRICVDCAVARKVQSKPKQAQSAPLPNNNFRMIPR